MKFEISLLAAATMAATAAARGHCGAPEPSDLLHRISREMGLKRLNLGLSARQTGSIEVGTVFHVVAASEDLADGYITDEMLAQQLDALNAHYAPHSISFKHVNTTRTVNAAWADDGDELAMKRALRQGGYGTLNIYFQRYLVDDNLGYAYFPDNVQWGSDNFYLDGAAVLAQTVPGGSQAPFNLGATVTHEAGHWLGLLHTFEKGCGADGDEVDDTPAQDGYVDGCAIERDSCPDQPGADPITNFMNYADDSCYTEFTPGQEARMHDMWAQFRAPAA